MKLHQRYGIKESLQLFKRVPFKSYLEVFIASHYNMQFLVFNFNFIFISSQRHYRLRGRAEALTKAYQEHKKKLLEEMTEDEVNALTEKRQSFTWYVSITKGFLLGFLL